MLSHLLRSLPTMSVGNLGPDSPQHRLHHYLDAPILLQGGHLMRHLSISQHQWQPSAGPASPVAASDMREHMRSKRVSDMTSSIH
jgi:hypothetical protein